jgi:hypothetical protein
MKKGFIIIATFLLCSLSTALAQQHVVRTTARNAATSLSNIAPKDTTSMWKLSGVSGVNFGQAALKNWSAGGENSVSGNLYLNASVDYVKGRWTWGNTLNLEYGVIYSDENNWRKNVDRISFASKVGKRINTQWSYAFLFDFNSQFAKGYKYPNINNYISTFMAPAYSNLALGISHTPNNKYTLFVSPLTARMTFVLDDSLSNAGAFGMKEGQKFRMEPGAYAVFSTKQTVMQNVELISKLDMFTPYNENFGNIDMNWDILFNFRINRYLTANLSTTIRYYGDEIKKVQLKEIFGLGFAYRF